MNQQIAEKIKKWIEEKKDPRSAHWQGGLEAILEVFSPHLEPGRLICVHSLEPRDYPVFEAALAAVDLSPGLQAAFLPPSVAGSIDPPEVAGELRRVAWEKPSYKILVARPGDELRLLCAEVSEAADRPGVDIFQSGALLGSYDYGSQEECFKDLTKVVRAHVWEKGKWTREQNEVYTLKWFEKALGLAKGDIPVETRVSYLHTPTLIKANQVNAVYTLIGDVLKRRFDDPDDPVREILAGIQATVNPDARTERLKGLVERSILELLTFMKDWKLVTFGDLSNAQSEQFKREFTRVHLQLMDRLG